MIGLPTVDEELAFYDPTYRLDGRPPGYKQVYDDDVVPPDGFQFPIPSPYIHQIRMPSALELYAKRTFSRVLWLFIFGGWMAYHYGPFYYYIMAILWLSYVIPFVRDVALSLRQRTSQDERSLSSLELSSEAS